MTRVQYKHNHLITKGTRPMKNKITALAAITVANVALVSALVGHSNHTNQVETARVQAEQRQAAQAEAAREAAAKVKADQEAAAAAAVKPKTVRFVSPTPTATPIK